MAILVYSKGFTLRVYGCYLFWWSPFPVFDAFPTVFLTRVFDLDVATSFDSLEFFYQFLLACGLPGDDVSVCTSFFNYVIGETFFIGREREYDEWLYELLYRDCKVMVRSNRPEKTVLVRKLIGMMRAIKGRLEVLSLFLTFCCIITNFFLQRT